MRVNACWPAWSPTAAAPTERASAAKPSGSRVRAISGARLRRVPAEASRKGRLGRITSAQIITKRPGARWPSGRVTPGRARPSEGSTRLRQSAAVSAPLASHRSCQVSPGRACSQLTTAKTPRRRL